MKLPRQDIIISSGMGVVFLALLLTFIFTKVYQKSNSGSLIPINNNIKYINVSPRDDYLKILKSDGDVPLKGEKILYSKINLSYEIESENSFIKEINKKFNPLKLIEYAFDKNIEILQGGSTDYLPHNVKVIYRKEPYENQSKFVGGSAIQLGLMKTIDLNFEFIRKIYDETNSHDFEMYYIGLMIHEVSHVLKDRFYEGPYYKKNSEKASMISENLSEYVRFCSGYYRKDRMYLLKSKKNMVTESYGTEGAWFLYWLTTKYDNELIRDIYLFSRGYLENIEDIYKNKTGKTEEELWKMFQKELP